MTPEQLKTWRTVRGFSQSQLAEELGTERATVSEWERGLSKIPPYLRWALYGIFAARANRYALETLEVVQ